MNRYPTAGYPKYIFQYTEFRHLAYDRVKLTGFVPEKGSEIYVSKIPTTANIESLVNYFDAVGPFFQIRLMVKDNGALNRGFAYVSYMNKCQTERALVQLEKQLFQGVVGLQMEISLDNCRIFLGGLPITKSREEIWMHLKHTYNVSNIIDIITYKNYVYPGCTRGFVFVVFRTHEEASHFRAKFCGKLILFGKDIVVDWSIPVMDIPNNILEKVKIIFLRGLPVTQTAQEFRILIEEHLGSIGIQKTYKHKDYAFIHVASRSLAEEVMSKLSDYYTDSPVEVEWAKPPNKYSHKSYRLKISRQRYQNWKNDQNNNYCLRRFAISDQSCSTNLNSFSRLADSPDFLGTKFVKDMIENLLGDA
ncbi:hypothetical protein GWI33_008948 [Rhynchophorus ferrugineus]|uniref:RRM domain-containing protein n=1 Tax=Rhynchophorus ferrugineus TaxID=354439 RepID=A0A834IG42_RHYFE|nr:hypothetical protein GWI33_008948 [Rhynchophorus ferrugineus]